MDSQSVACFYGAVTFVLKLIVCVEGRQTLAHQIFNGAQNTLEP